MVEKRKHKRFTIIYPGQYGTELKIIRRLKSAVVINISMGGILLETEKNHKINTPMNILVELADKRYQLTGKVIRANVADSEKHFHIAVLLDTQTIKPMKSTFQNEIPVIEKYLQWKLIENSYQEMITKTSSIISVR